MKDLYGLLQWAKENTSEVPRKSGTVYFDCYAPDYLFKEEWEDLSDKAKEFYAKYHLSCEGTGELSICCADCPFLIEEWE